MNLKIILLVCIFAGIKAMETLKRIKRNSDSMAHDNRIKEDFVTLQNEKGESPAAIKNNNLKAPFGEAALNSDATKNVTHNLTAVADHTRNTSIPLFTVLRKKQHKINKHRLQNYNLPELATLDEDSKNKTESLVASHCGISDKTRESYKYHKTKHLPHLLHTRSKVDVRPQHMQPFYKGFSSFSAMGAMEQLMKLGNMMMFKIGMDTVPYVVRHRKTPMKQTSPDIFETENINQPSNEPVIDYILNSIEGEPQGSYYHPRTMKVADRDRNEEGAVIAVSIKEPIHVSSVMQTAVDTLLRDADSGGKSEQEVDFSCPIHHVKKSARNMDEDADADADILQACSCRLQKGHGKSK